MRLKFTLFHQNTLGFSEHYIQVETITLDLRIK
jgi:hypothetical protein